MRVALTTVGITPYVVGGIQRHSFNLVTHLTRLGVEVDLYHTGFGSDAAVGELAGFTKEERKLVASIAIPWLKRTRLWGHYLRSIEAFSRDAWEIFRSRPPVDFIYAQGFTGSAFLRERRRGRLTVPVGVNFHGFEMFQRSVSCRAALGNGILRRAARKQLHAADRVFSFGGRLIAILDHIGVPQDRILTISNGVSDDWLRIGGCGVRRGPRRFVFVGRYERRKGVEELNRTLARLGAGAGWHFDFVGPIPEPKRLDGTSVTYHGSVTDDVVLRQILDSADVLVCPSFSEGMPTVILEAMARGLGVIATDVGAVSELVSEDNGILLPEPGVAPLHEAMQKALSLTPDQITAWKQASLQKVRRFTWTRVAQATLAAIAQSTAR